MRKLAKNKVYMEGESGSPVEQRWPEYRARNSA